MYCTEKMYNNTQIKTLNLASPIEATFVMFTFITIITFTLMGY